VFARVACLSPFDDVTVRAMFGGRHEVDLLVVQLGESATTLAAACSDADLVIADQRNKLRITREIIHHMNRCQLIQQAAVGFESIDYRAAADRGIPVANAAGYNKHSVADWTLMAMIALIRRSFWGDRQLRAGRWDLDDPMRVEMTGHELGSMTVGIIGLGNVGLAVAQRVLAFGSRVLFVDVTDRTLEGAEQVSFETLLRESDIVTVHTPLDLDTHGLLGKAELGQMKSGSYLINTARGAVIDETALIAALESGHLSGVGLDVFDTEPLSKASPLRSLENVVLAPHMGAATIEAEARLLDVVGANLRRVLDGLPPLNVVNAVERGRPAHGGAIDATASDIRAQIP
jgi:D-3-phosphoglycerate dehydrogenase / 2-oxoglutarate reductase